MAAATRGGVAAAVAVLLLAGGPASAQLVGPDYYDPNRELAVTQRGQPLYEPLGVPLGSFQLFPAVSVDPEYNDNIFADPSPRVEDMVVRIRPDVQLRSRWTQHELRVGARAVVSRFIDNSSENTEDWAVDANGRLDVLRSDRLTASGSYAHSTEPRTASGAPTFAEAPIRYRLAQGRLGGEHVAGRLKLTARADLQDFDFEDGRSINGDRIEQDDRDRTQLTLTGRAEFAVLPSAALFAQGSWNRRNYTEVPALEQPSRDSDGYELLSGVAFDLTTLLRGSVGVGYLSQSFKRPGYTDFDGLSLDARVEWLPTRLTTFTLIGSRSVGDAGVVGAGGYLATIATLQVDHELRRNLVLTGAVSHARYDYKDLDRKERRWVGTAKATYLLSRRYGASLEYTRDDQSPSGDVGREFTINRLVASLIYRI